MKQYLYIFLLAIVVTLFTAYNKSNAQTLSKDRRLNICNEATEISNKTKPYRVDKVTIAIKTYCSIKNDRIINTSLLQIEFEKKDLPSDMLQLLEKQIKPNVCNMSGVNETLKIHDIAMEYIDISGANIGTILFTKDKCKT